MMTRFAFPALLALLFMAAPARAAEDRAMAYDGFGTMFANEAGPALQGESDDDAMIAIGESLSAIAPAAGEAANDNEAAVIAPEENPVQAIDDTHSVTVPVENGEAATR